MSFLEIRITILLLGLFSTTTFAIKPICTSAYLQQKTISLIYGKTLKAFNNLNNPFVINCHPKEIHNKDNDYKKLKNFYQVSLQRLIKEGMTTKVDNFIFHWANNFISAIQKTNYSLKKRRGKLFCKNFSPEYNKKTKNFVVKILKKYKNNPNKLLNISYNRYRCPANSNNWNETLNLLNKENNSFKNTCLTSICLKEYFELNQARQQRKVCTEQTDWMLEHWNKNKEDLNLDNEWQFITMSKGLSFIGVGPTVGPHVWPIICKVNKNSSGFIKNTKDCYVMDTWSKTFMHIDHDNGYQRCQFDKLCTWKNKKSIICKSSDMLEGDL